MESKVHSAKSKSGHHFIYLDDYNIQRRMNKQSGFNAEQINKDKKNPESKNRLKIKFKITSYHKTKTVRLLNQQVITQEDNIPLKIFHSLHRLTLGC